MTDYREQNARNSKHSREDMSEMQKTNKSLTDRMDTVEQNFETVQESLGKLRRGVNTNSLKSKLMGKVANAQATLDAEMADMNSVDRERAQQQQQQHEEEEEESDCGYSNGRIEALEEKVRKL